MQSKTLEEGVLHQLRREGVEVSLAVGWSEIPAGKMVVATRHPFEGCKAVQVTTIETIHELEEARKIAEIFFLVPSKISLFSLPVLPPPPAKPRRQRRSKQPYNHGFQHQVVLSL